MDSVWTPEAIVSIIVQLSLAIGTIGSLLIGISSAMGEVKRSKTDIMRTDADIEMQEVEVTSRLQQIAKGLVEDMRYELDTWKSKVLEIDEQLQMLIEVNRRLKYSIVEIIEIVDRIIKDTPNCTEEDINKRINELKIILTQIATEFNL
jgi:hypothetical protein